MKKKLLIGFLLLFVVLAAGYFYTYKGHRDIKTEDSAYTLTTAVLSGEFTSNPEMANARYSDKVIEVTGKVTGADAEAGSITIDEKLYATMDKNQKLPAQGTAVTVKGRFLGYDDLLEEFRMDQATLND